MKKIRLRHRVLAKPVSVIASIALVLSMVPVAFAAPTSATDVDDSRVTITNLLDGDTVEAWLIADADIDSANNLIYAFVSGLPEDYDSIEEISAITSDGYQFTSNTDMQNAAAAIASKLVGTDSTAQATANVSGEATLALGSGYYLIRVTSTSGETRVYQNMIVDLSPKVGGDGAYASCEDLTLPVKSSEVEVVKTVGDDGAASANDYQVGDELPFTISTAIPSYPADSSHATFFIGDKPSAGLAYDKDSITVKVQGVTAAEGFDYTITKNNDSFQVDFSKDFILAHGGAPVTVIYTAKITKEAFSHADGEMTNNHASVTFNPNPYSDGIAEPSSDVNVYTYGYVFDKIDADGALEGAEFTLYDSTGAEVVDENGNAITSTSAIVNGKAYVYFSGLKANKQYIAKETKVPSGHTAVDVRFTLTADTAVNDNPATQDVEENNFYINDASVNDPTAPSLPVTGGAGTVGMTVAGVVLIGGAAFLLMRSHRKNEE